MAQWISCPQAAGSIPLAPSGQTLPEAQPVEPQALVAAAADRRQHPEKEDADSAGAELCWELLPAAYAEEGFSLHAPRLPPQHPAHAAQRAQYHTCMTISRKLSMR